MRLGRRRGVLRRARPARRRGSRRAEGSGSGRVESRGWRRERRVGRFPGAGPRRTIPTTPRTPPTNTSSVTTRSTRRPSWSFPFVRKRATTPTRGGERRRAGHLRRRRAAGNPHRRLRRPRVRLRRRRRAPRTSCGAPGRSAAPSGSASDEGLEERRRPTGDASVSARANAPPTASASRGRGAAATFCRRARRARPELRAPGRAQTSGDGVGARCRRPRAAAPPTRAPHKKTVHAAPGGARRACGRACAPGKTSSRFRSRHRSGEADGHGAPVLVELAGQDRHLRRGRHDHEERRHRTSRADGRQGLEPREGGHRCITASATTGSS